MMMKRTRLAEEYSTVRALLGSFIGTRLLDITQHTQEEWEESGDSYIMFMFDNGHYVKVPIGDGGWEYTDENADDSEDGA